MNKFVQLLKSFRQTVTSDSRAPPVQQENANNENNAMKNKTFFTGIKF